MRDQLIEKKDPETQTKWNAKVTGENKKKYPGMDLKFAKVRLLNNGTDESLPPTLAERFAEQRQANDENKYDNCRSALIEEVRLIREILQKVKDSTLGQVEKQKHLREWRVIACVMDRMFFVFYFIANTSAIVVIFCRN